MLNEIKPYAKYVDVTSYGEEHNPRVAELVSRGKTAQAQVNEARVEPSGVHVSRETPPC
ncbi:hypothetical protein ABZT43_37850 [Streptomyces sp. NPDC005349]|uniref:hypothetical protein n=1 Tax=Streptomyces sp. NPDC005349 TaxID=3157037 RepID=UPI0033B5C577